MKPQQNVCGYKLEALVNLCETTIILKIDFVARYIIPSILLADSLNYKSAHQNTTFELFSMRMTDLWMFSHDVTAAMLVS